MNWYRRTQGGWLLQVHAQPGARTSGVAGLHGEALKIRVAAPAVDGKANAALIAFIARELGIAKRMVSVEQGASSREKTLRVSDTAVHPASLFPAE